MNEVKSNPFKTNQLKIDLISEVSSVFNAAEILMENEIDEETAKELLVEICKKKNRVLSHLKLLN